MVDGLPAADFRLRVVNLVGCNIDPPDLARLSSLKALEELHLPGPMWNPRAGANKDQSKDLGHIAGLSTLEKLTFSYSFLAYIRFYDEGFEQIAPLTNLKEIRVRRTKVEGHTLAPFRNLRALDLTFTPFDNEGLQSLEGMTELKKLWIGDTLVTDEGLRSISHLTGLEELNLRGTQITERGLAHLRGLTRLKKLNLLGADITDAGLDHLAEMKDLEVLNLYRTKVSNAGLERLKALTNLREVDLRYSRATGAGIESLRTALPATRFVFLDVTLRASVPGAAVEGPQDASESSVAEWVRSLGGEVVMEAGAVREISLASTSINDAQIAHLKGLAGLRKLDLGVTEIG